MEGATSEILVEDGFKEGTVDMIQWR